MFFFSQKDFSFEDNIKRRWKSTQFFRDDYLKARRIEKLRIKVKN